MLSFLQECILSDMRIAGLWAKYVAAYKHDVAKAQAHVDIHMQAINERRKKMADEITMRGLRS